MKYHTVKVQSESNLCAIVINGILLTFNMKYDNT